MPRFSVRYQRQRDPAEEARKQAVAQATIQRQTQASAYAAARFQEWQANAAEREALLNARMQQAQSQAELAGAQFRYNFWKDQELRRQTTAYYTAMPALQEGLRQAGIYPGTQRYAAEMASFAAELPDAVTHNPAIREDLQNYSKVDETQSQIVERLKTMYGALGQVGQEPGKVHITKEGEVSTDASQIGTEELKAYGVTPEQIKNPTYVAVGKLEQTKEGTLGFKGDPTGNLVSIDVGKKEAARVPIELYLKHGGRLSPEDTQAQTQLGRVQPSTQIVPASTPNQSQPTVKSLGRYNPDTGEFE